MTTSPALIKDDADREAYRRVEARRGSSRYGGDCYAYCALAAGFVDLVIETRLKPHDIVALAPDRRRRGRRDDDLERRDGARRRPNHRRRRRRLATPRLYEAARAILLEGGGR